MAGLCLPLPTLRRRPRDRQRRARGRCDARNLHRRGLSPHTPRRSPGAPLFFSLFAGSSAKPPFSRRRPSSMAAWRLLPESSPCRMTVTVVAAEFARNGRAERAGESAMAKIPSDVGPKLPQIVVLFGATGDLSQRKLLPGLYHLAIAGFIPKCRIVGVSLDAIETEAFRALARQPVEEHHDRKPGADASPDFEAPLAYSL